MRSDWERLTHSFDEPLLAFKIGDYLLNSLVNGIKAHLEKKFAEIFGKFGICQRCMRPRFVDGVFCDATNQELSKLLVPNLAASQTPVCCK